MDIHRAKELEGYATDLRAKAILYEDCRTKAGKAKADIDILLAGQIGNFRMKKANLGYEMALLMLMEENPVAQELYRQMEENTAKYKSLERIIDAISSTITLYQSIMKYTLQGERYG